MHFKNSVILSILIIIVLGSGITAFTRYFVTKQLSKTEISAFTAVEVETETFEAIMDAESEILMLEEPIAFSDVTEEESVVKVFLEEKTDSYKESPPHLRSAESSVAEIDDNDDVLIFIDDSSNLNNKKTPREIYEAKLNELEKQITKLWNEETNNTTYSMMNTVDYELAAWDQELNTIYQMLKDKLLPDEFEELKLEERQWIKDRDEAAMESARQRQSLGEAMSGFHYQKTMAEETRIRTYELVDYYFSK